MRRQAYSVRYRYIATVAYQCCLFNTYCLPYFFLLFFLSSLVQVSVNFNFAVRSAIVIAVKLSQKQLYQV